MTNNCLLNHALDSTYVAKRLGPFAISPEITITSRTDLKEHVQRSPIDDSDKRSNKLGGSAGPCHFCAIWPLVVKRRHKVTQHRRKQVTSGVVVDVIVRHDQPREGKGSGSIVSRLCQTSCSKLAKWLKPAWPDSELTQAVPSC